MFMSLINTNISKVKRLSLVGAKIDKVKATIPEPISIDNIKLNKLLITKDNIEDITNSLLKDEQAYTKEELLVEFGKYHNVELEDIEGYIKKAIELELINITDVGSYYRNDSTPF
jgi:hypothetical protein